jgi:hypothetical protein
LRRLFRGENDNGRGIGEGLGMDRRCLPIITGNQAKIIKPRQKD